MNDTPLGAIHRISEVLEPFRHLPPGGSLPDPGSLATAFVRLTCELRATSLVLGKPSPGWGLATLWWRRLVTECEQIESALRERPGDWAGLYFEHDGLFDWLRNSAWIVAVALTSMAHNAINGPSVSGLLDLLDDQGQIKQLRDLADEWANDFSGIPEEHLFYVEKREQATPEWQKRYKQRLDSAGWHVLKAVNNAEVDSELYKDDRFAGVLLGQLVLDYTYPEQGLLEKLGVASPEELLEYVDRLEGEKSLTEQTDEGQAPRGDDDQQLSVGRLIELMKQSEGYNELAKMQMAKVTGAPEAGSKSEYYIRTAHNYGGHRNRVQSQYVKQPGVDRLKLLCEADGSVEWDSRWVLRHRAGYCLSENVEQAVVDAMTVVEFVQLLKTPRVTVSDAGAVDAISPTANPPEPTNENIEQDDVKGTPADPMTELSPAIKQAWASWKLAENNHAQLPEDRKAYDWLAEQEDEMFVGELVDYELPEFDTWARYVRSARKTLAENKNQPRAKRGHNARSIVRADEL